MVFGIGLLRLLNIDNEDDWQTLTKNKGYTNKFISVGNEISVMKYLKKKLEADLEKYPNTLEKDYEIIKNFDNPSNISSMFNHNERNCVIYRYGEKLTLKWWIEFTVKIIKLFEENQSLKEVFESARRQYAAKTGGLKEYIDMGYLNFYSSLDSG